MDNKTIFNDPEKRKSTREQTAAYFKGPDPVGSKIREYGRKIFGGTQEAQASDPQSEAIRRMRNK